MLERTSIVAFGAYLKTVKGIENRVAMFPTKSNEECGGFRRRTPRVIVSRTR